MSNVKSVYTWCLLCE